VIVLELLLLILLNHILEQDVKLIQQHLVIYLLVLIQELVLIQLEHLEDLPVPVKEDGLDIHVEFHLLITV